MQNIITYNNGEFILNDSGCFKRYLIILIFFSHLLLVSGLGLQDLTGSTESRVAGIGAQMAFTGKYIVPKLNNVTCLEKPPLYFWAEALSFKMLGYTNFAARYPSAVAASLAVVFLYLLLTGMGYSPFTAFFSGLMLAISAQWWSTGRTCTIDMLLSAMITGSIYFFYMMAKADKIKNKLPWLLGFIITAAGAILSKGLVGLAIPGIGLGGWLFFNNIMNRKISWSNWILLALGSVLALFPAGIWVWLLCKEIGWENGGRVVVIVNNFGRFIGSNPEHIGPFYYYLSKFPLFMQPITFVIPFAIWYHIWNIRKNKSDQSLFLLCCSVIPCLLLTVSAAKRQIYLLPVNPEFAAICGILIAGLLDRTIKLPALNSYEKLKAEVPPQILEKINISNIVWFLGTAFGPAAFITGIVVALACVRLKLQGSSIVMLSGAIWIIAVTLHLNFTRKKYGAFCSLLFLEVLVIFTSISQIKAYVLNRSQSFLPLFIEARKLERQKDQIILYKPWPRVEGFSLFYMKEQLPSVHHHDKLAEFVTEHPNTVILSNKNDLPSKYQIIKEFKIKDDDFVLANVVGNRGDNE